MSLMPAANSQTTARRLSALAQLYRRGQASPMLDRTLDKALNYEAEVSRAQLAQLEIDLAEFEQRYQRSSTDFYQQFQAGKTDDRLDYTEWAALIQMANTLRERLQLLTDDDQP